MKWDEANGGGILKWSHCDEPVRSLLILAAAGGHTQLALHLLDEIDLVRYAQQSHPFHVLQTVIESGNEPHGVAITTHPKIKAALATNDMRYVGPSKYSIARCTEAAIRLEMTGVLQLMNHENHAIVSKTTWRSIHGSLGEDESNTRTTNAGILAIADQFERDWRWEQVKGVLLIRYRGHDAENASEKLRSHVLEFIRPKHIRQSAGEEEEFLELLEFMMIRD